MRITSSAVSDRGLSDKRPENEDSFLEIPQSGIFAVADGVGGAQAGEVASQMAMEIVGEAFINLNPTADAEAVMRTAIERANSAIHQMARELPQLANMASTIVALHLAGDIATIAHVGDSRLYRVGRNGQIVRETDDHSVVAEEVRAGRMSEEDAENHPSKNIISRALGAEASVDVEIKTVMVEPGSTYLLCSDGITRHISDRELEASLASGVEPASICDYLKRLCYERGAEDNLTAVVVATASAISRSIDIPHMSDDEGPTVATARSPFDSVAGQDDQLLELDTARLPRVILPAADEPEGDDIPADNVPDVAALEEELSQEAQPMEDAAFSGRSEPFEMFGGTSQEESDESKPSSSAGRMASMLGSTAIGILIGLAAYYVVFAPKEAPPSMPVLTEMRAANIPLSAFEENRRTVDKDPTSYIQRAPAPEDAEDYYLLGRAYLLTGDYAKAKTLFGSARDHLAGTDPSNATVLKNDLAILTVVTNGTTVQTMLKNELEAPTANANTNANTNSNR